MVVKVTSAEYTGQGGLGGRSLHLDPEFRRKELNS